MATVILILISLIGVGHCTLECNGLEVDLSGIVVAFPAGVCFGSKVTSGGQTVAVSYYYECKNDEMYYNLYSDSAECDGDTVISGTASTIYPDSIYDEVNFECSLDDCDYVLIRQYAAVFTDDTDCDTFEADDTSAYSEIAYIDGYCTSVSTISAKAECDGSDATYYSYFNGNCTGDGTPIEYPVGSGDCVVSGDTAVSYSFDVVCGTATSKLSTPSPVDPDPVGSNSNMHHLDGLLATIVLILFVVLF